MRYAYKPEFIGEGNICKGFYFDNGGCAEHEWGIRKLYEEYGINSTILGYEGRKVTKVPTYVRFIKFTQNKIKRAVLLSARVYGLDMDDTSAVRKWVRQCGHFKTTSYDEKETEWVSAAWDEGTFGIYVAGATNVEYLETLYNALMKNDAILFIGNSHPNNPFSRGGLVMYIASEMSEEDKKDMYDGDYDNKCLQEAAAPIIQKVKDAGKRFHCLAPKWKNDKKKEVVFWLNPMDQQDNYFGWVTTKDLMDWIKDKGIIPGHGFGFERSNREAYTKLCKEHKVFD